MKKETATELLKFIMSYYRNLKKVDPINPAKEPQMYIQYSKALMSYKIEDNKIEDFMSAVVKECAWFPAIADLEKIYAQTKAKKHQESVYDNYAVKTNCDNCDGKGFRFYYREEGDMCLYCDSCEAGNRFVTDLRNAQERPSPYYMDPISKYYEIVPYNRTKPFIKEANKKLDISSIIQKAKTLFNDDKRELKIDRKYLPDYKLKELERLEKLEKSKEAI